MALNKAAKSEADNIVAELLTASTWSTGAKGSKLQQLAKRVAALADIEDPLPDVPVKPTPEEKAAASKQ